MANDSVYRIVNHRVVDHIVDRLTNVIDHIVAVVDAVAVLQNDVRIITVWYSYDG